MQYNINCIMQYNINNKQLLQITKKLQNPEIWQEIEYLFS